MGYVTPGASSTSATARSSSAANRASRCSPGTSTTPSTTAASFVDGWFLTGDRASRDEHGRYTFDGRRSDVLKVAGENVSTVEVEQAIAMHPHVADVAVVGRARRDPRRGARRRRRAGTRRRRPRRAPRRAGGLVRRAAGQVQAPARLPLRRRAAAHQRRQDQEVSADIADRTKQTGVATEEDEMTALDDRSQRCPAGEPRRVDRRRRQGVDPAGAAVHVAGGPALRARRPVRPRVAVRRARRADPQPRRLVHDDVRQRADRRRPRQDGRDQRPVADLPPPGDAGVRGSRQLDDAQVPVPPLELRPRRPSARRAGDGAHGGVRQGGVGPAPAAGRGVARIRLRQPRPRGARRSARRSRATSRSSATTSSPTPSAPARSRSPGCRGTGR